jgi:hypothetical protein
MQDPKSTPELLDQEHQYLHEASPDRGNPKVLNILTLFTAEEQRVIMAFDHYTFTSLADTAHNINTLREVGVAVARSPHHTQITV